MSSLAPLTTVFTPPPKCPPFIDYSKNRLDGDYKRSYSDCKPDGDSFPTFSPGICPQGYSPACSDFFQTKTDAEETGVMCCPSGFSCDGAYCKSRDSRGISTGVGIEILWREGDLDELETSPLPDGRLSTGKNYGWKPESSLTVTWEFPSSCSGGKLDIGNLRTKSLPSDCPFFPTRGYYSPAICPLGWTVAHTRPIWGNWGPPEAPDETAAFCCPSDMTTASDGVSCSVTDCLSFATNGTRAEAVTRETAIQIRWASSDLHILATHPLTPGLKPGTASPEGVATETSTAGGPPRRIQGVPEPESRHWVGLALAFVPLLVSGFLAAVGALVIGNKKGRLGKPAGFTPTILRWPTLMILLGLTLTLVPLIELAIRSLPKVDVSRQIKSVDLVVKHVTVEHSVQLVKRAFSPNSRSKTRTDCNPTFSTFTEFTENHGVSYTRFETFINGDCDPALAASTSTSTAASSGITTVAVCDLIGVGSPFGESWLQLGESLVNDTSTTLDDDFGDLDLDGQVLITTTEGQYFVASVLPTFVAILFAIPWKIINSTTRTLEPLHQLLGPRGARGSRSILLSYSGVSGIMAPLVGLIRRHWIVAASSTLEYLSAVITPLAAETIRPGLVGSCSQTSANGCGAVAEVLRPVARALQILLSIMCLFILALMALCVFHRRSPLNDPRSIAGAASLCGNSLGNFLRQTLLESSGNGRTLKSTIASFKFSMHQVTTEQGRMVPGIEALQTPPFQRPPGCNFLDIPHNPQSTKSSNSSLLRNEAIKLGIFASIITGSIALILFYRLSSDDSAFERFMSSQSFGPRFVFASIGVLTSYMWLSLFQDFVVVAPVLNMLQSPSMAPSSVLSRYGTNPYSHVVRSLKDGRPYSAVVSLCAVFSDFLPLLLANVPFDRATTFKAHLICSWASMGILIAMDVVVLGLLLFLAFLRRTRPRALSFEDQADLWRTAPLAAHLLLAARSPEATRLFQETASMETKERDLYVKQMWFRYRLDERTWDDDSRGYALHFEQGTAGPKTGWATIVNADVR